MERLEVVGEIEGGELKINGFSSYIHPIGNGRLLTIGQDADKDGRVLGMHLQIFDVSDPKNPTRIHHESLKLDGYSSSSAESDHHAFTYDPVTKTLALPLHTYGKNWHDEWSGLVVYTIDDDKGFIERGRVDHSTLVSANRENRCMANIQRTIVMDGYLVTFSNLGIQVNDLQPPSKTTVSTLLANSLN